MPQQTLFSFLKTIPTKKNEEKPENTDKKSSCDSSDKSPVKNQQLETKEQTERAEYSSSASKQDVIDMPGFRKTARRQTKRKISPDAVTKSVKGSAKVSPVKVLCEKLGNENGETLSNGKSPTESIKEEESAPSAQESKKRKISEHSEIATEVKCEDASNETDRKPKNKELNLDVANENKTDVGKDTDKSQPQSDNDSPVKKRKTGKSRTSRRISSDSESDAEMEAKSKISEANETHREQLISEAIDKQDTQKEGESPQESAKASSEVQEQKKGKPIHSFFAPKKSEKEKSSDTVKTGKDSKSEGALYDPTKSNYHPVDDACWKKGEKVPYLALARTLQEIENISGRLKMIEILSNFFRSVISLSPDDLLHCVYLCLNRLAPEYVGLELGVGETLLMKAIAQSTGRTVSQIKAEVAVKGDLGLVAESSRGNQRVMFSFPKLTVPFVFSKFKEIAEMTGNASMAKKTDKIQAMFSACRECEARYIIRSLGGKLRIGLAEQSVLAALAQAAVLTPPEQVDKIKTAPKMLSDSFKEKLAADTLILKSAYCECPNYDLVIPILLKKGISALPEHCHLMPGVPLKPMLAHPTKGIADLLKRFDPKDSKDSKIEFTCEFKYDGERAQIHNDGKSMKIFSRNQEDNTTKFPDVISRLNHSLKLETNSFILDSEVVAWDAEAQQILPFQVLSTRKRKDAASSEIKVQVCVMAFDLLYLNGESLVKKPLKERRELLHNSFVEVPGEFMFAQFSDGNDAEVIQEFLDESVKGNCEGLMVKSLVVDASYEIAKRSHNWLKLKKDYLQGVGDTLDLVVIGAWYGKGKRTGTFGGFLLACYDDDTEEFQTICKIGTGFKDPELKAHTKFFEEHVITTAKSFYRYSSSLEPDVWLEPVQVWEVKCADLSISPVHKAAAGIVDPEKGISLRFPRFLRIRDSSEKKPEDATTASQVADMYKKQQQIQSQNISKDEEDFY